MANGSYNVTMVARPLTTADAAGLTADIIPEPYWQPTMIAESDVGAVAMTLFNLAASGDKVLIRGIIVRDMPQMVWYPMCLRTCFSCTSASSGFEDLWQTWAHYTLLWDDLNTYLWSTMTLPTPRTIYNDSGEIYVQDASPDMMGFPARCSYTQGATNNDKTVMAQCFHVKTWDGTAAGTTYAHFDFRCLGFPRSVLRSAGFYTPRLNFKTV